MRRKNRCRLREGVKLSWYLRMKIKHLGWLSRLELTDEEIVRYTFQIKEVMKYLNKLR